MKKKSTSQSAPARRSPWLAVVFRRRRLGEGGFFNLRVLIGLVVVLAGVFLALLGFGTFSNASAQANLDPNGQQAGQMNVIPAVHSDLSPPLRDQPVVWQPAREKREPHLPPMIPIKHRDRPDPVIQSSFWQTLMTTPAIPAPIRQWKGMGKPCNGCSSLPPDTNGAVGKTRYVEMVNVALQVFDKLTGTSLLGPFPISSVWFGFAGACQTADNGDPIVVYDRLADRWIISQFAAPTGAEGEQDECIAVSQTGDATGAWYRYDFHLTSQSQDYPKFGVWPDGYYMSAAIFETGVFGTNLGPQPFVFDRAKMLLGDPTATAQTPGIIGGSEEAFFLPSDLDGVIPPPLGDPNHFVAINEEEPPPPPPGGAQSTSATATSPPTPTATPALIYKVWGFHVDWNHPANSSFSLQASVPAADLTLLCPDKPYEGSCVPQLDTTDLLNSLTGRMMFRNAYRRFPDGRESMLNNLTVSAHSVAGIRWFELQRALPGNWTLRQERTYQPDNT